MNTQLQTQRLSLRVLTPEFAPATLKFYQKNRQMLALYENLSDENIFTLKYQRQLLQVEYQEFLKVNLARFWIFENHLPPEEAKPIGTVSFHNLANIADQPVRVGYKLDQDYWHKGYAFEAVVAAMAWVCRELGAQSFDALVQPDNEASIALLRRIGFTRVQNFALEVNIGKELHVHEKYRIDI